MDFTTDQLYFFRLCYVVFNTVPECLQKIFKQEWDALYTATIGQWDDTPASYEMFYNMESPKNQAKNERLLERMSSGDRKQWDCSCLFYAILDSDSLGSRSTLVVNNSVDEIRTILKELAHNKTAKLSEAEFQTCMQKIKSEFSSLKLDITKIEEINNQKCLPTEDLTKIQKELKRTVEVMKNAEKEVENEKGRISEPTSFCILPPPPSHDTIYRKKEVDKIHEEMQRLSSDKKGGTTVLYLSGNPGSGKSVMAKHIGEKFYEDDDIKEMLTFVMTLDASTLDTLLNSYITFTEKLNCSLDSVKNITASKDLSKEEQILQLRALANKQVAKYSKWLIIADNVAGDLKLFSKYWPDGDKGQILVTTQDSHFIGNSSHYHHVSLSSGITEEDALQLLSKVSRDYRDVENAGMMLKVSKAVHFQPLALSFIALYMRSVRTINEGYTWLQCLKDLESEYEKVQPINEKTSLSCKTILTAVVNLILQREISEEVMLHAFCFLSVIASDPIPLKYVVEYVIKCMPVADKTTVVTTICSSSLVRLMVQGTKKLCVHQVVYDCLQTNKDVARSKVDMLTVVSAFSLLPTINDKSLVNSLAVTRPLANHLVIIARRLIDYVIKESISENDLGDHVFKVLNNLSLVLLKHGSFESAQHFLRLLLALQVSKSKLSTSSREVLIDLVDACHIKYILNMNINGIHPSVSQTLDSLGVTYQKLGRLQESVAYFEKALAIKTAAYSENHPSVGVTMSNLGNAYHQQGLLEESITYYEKSLAIATAAYGGNHPSVGVTMSNLGNAYHQLGRLQKSLTYYEKAIAITKAAYGEYHPSVGETINNLGNTYQQLGHTQESLTSYEKALGILTAAYGEQHPSVGKIMNNLGNTCGKLGRLQESITYYEKALAIITATYGESHPSVGDTINNIGNTCQKLGPLNESRTYYEKALAITTAAYGENHPSVGETMYNLANTYQKVGPLEESITYYVKALAIQTATYGENHPNVGAILNNLGNAYRQLGRFDEAKWSYQQALAIFENAYDDGHPFICGTVKNLGILFDSEIRMNRSHRKRSREGNLTSEKIQQ
ncbi:uncharacterized protein LOC110234020 [Exaiptasia diaphana]|uniref:EF-hand domain-containing protein n=1 Tax=Exaiptasia diaphana TaxID=2652724 RepID=A0A913WW53_EXADI|nr:uncharacterized protein LOC110234020 [Exaiptasia diaphana]XP_028513360.1 uncharacterized protein LOC110234020 [Exaiptasia diaphana]